MYLRKLGAFARGGKLRGKARLEKESPTHEKEGWISTLPKGRNNVEATLKEYSP